MAMFPRSQNPDIVQRAARDCDRVEVRSRREKDGRPGGERDLHGGLLRTQNGNARIHDAL